MIRKTILLGILVAASWSGTARADFDLKSYRYLMQYENTRKQLSDYVTGVGRGAFWANTVSKVLGKDPLFCMPDQVTLDQSLIQSLLEQEINDPSTGRPYPDNTNIELILIKSFVTRFPCND